MQARRGVTVPPAIAYPLVLLAHEHGDAEERADLEAALLTGDEHLGSLLMNSHSRTLLEPIVVIWRKVAERARRLGVSAQGLEVREHIVRLPLTADGHEPLRDATTRTEGALTCLASPQASRTTRRSRW